MKVAIIGAGAAGCFCAAELGRRMPSARIVVFEAGPRALAKVAITGGGRCNLGNTFDEVRSLEEVYPRGARLLRGLLRVFSPEDTVRWFEAHGVPVTRRDAPCLFPASQDAGDVVRALEEAMHAVGVEVRTRLKVTALHSLPEGWYLEASAAQPAGHGTAVGHTEGPFDAVVVTTGGAPRAGYLSFLDGLDVERVSPIPSLFTFTLADASGRRDPLTALSGTVVPGVRLALEGTPLRSHGTLLITDWGASGPATLKLSSYAARYLAENQYRATLSIRWCGARTDEEVQEQLRALRRDFPKRRTGSAHPEWEGLSARLWAHLVECSGLSPEKPWGEIGDKSLRRLAETLAHDRRPIAGKGRFKEEFVTCGGIALPSLNPATLESKKHPGLHFAGEVLDVDAVTGGFNLQAAWTTGYAVAAALAR